MRFLTAAVLAAAIATPAITPSALAQDTNTLDTRMCPDGSATLPNGSPCPPLVTQQGGSDPIPGDVSGAAGNASRNNNNTGGTMVESGATGEGDARAAGSGASGTGMN